jgi:AcrR family transcriptional regulator
MIVAAGDTLLYEPSRADRSDEEPGMAQEDRPYHHGDLPAALLAAVDEVVRERGAAALTLREVARRAGVSHAAPAHHFGDKAGLLTAYATEGMTEMATRMAAARAEATHFGGTEALRLLTDTLGRLAVAYVTFAVEQPARFTVMFGSEQLHTDDPLYRAASESAFEELYAAVLAVRTDLRRDDPELMHAATGAWSVVHGFATLWLAGHLDETITSGPPEQATADALGAFGATLFAAAGMAPDPSREGPDRPHS